MLSFVSGSSWPDLCAAVYQSPQTAAIDLQFIVALLLHTGLWHRALVQQIFMGYLAHRCRSTILVYSKETGMRAVTRFNRKQSVTINYE